MRLRAIRYRAAAAASALASGLLLSPGQATAATTVGGPYLGVPGYYDYAATSGIRDTAAGTERDYWCGDTATHPTDTILGEQIQLSDRTVSVARRAVLQEGPAGAWDSGLTCNPAVVQGLFADPLGDGLTYRYAMYYVGRPIAGGPNQIGAAFSVDGWTWTKYPSPVVTYNGPGYGAGQPSVQDVGGTVTLLYEVVDGSGVAVNYEATSPDGVNFTGRTPITTAGLDEAALSGDSWGGVSYSPSAGLWYGLFNQAFRPSSSTGGVAERGQPGVVLYSTPDLISGTWTELDTIDTNLTGSEVNFIGGMQRNPDGTLAGGTLYLTVSAAWPRPSYNAVPSDAAGTAAFNNWDIWWHKWTGGQPWRALQRVDYAGGHHEVTTGWWDSAVYHLENINLGKLAEAPTGSASVPLYSCKAGSVTYFVSLDTGCEGQYKLGLEGYAYSAAAADRIALYRCVVVSTNDHFVSPDPLCEGQRAEGLLGYGQN